jgi:hypothetical protein
MTTTATRNSATLLGRIGRALRRFAANYAAVREIEARRHIFASFDDHTLQDIGVDRFGSPYGDRVVAPATTPANANDDHEIRRAA